MAGARLALAGVFLIFGGVAVFGEPPRALRCPLLDERGTPSPRPALLRILGGPETPPAPETPRDPLETTFDVTDPEGVLADFWGPREPPPRCELSPTAPLLPPGGSPQCPQGEGPRWWLLALGTAAGDGSVLLRQGRGGTAQLTASLSIWSLSPRVQGRVGAPQRLHCALRPAPARFRLEWFQHRHGAARPLLAFDSATARANASAPGVLLLLGGHHSAPEEGGAGQQPPGGALELSLQLPPLSVSDGGAFVCSVSTALGQLQQVLRLDVVAPPRVSLVPSHLSPGVRAQLRCDVSGFFPLDVTIRWQLRPRGSARPRELGPALTWRSGHRRTADGTFGTSAGVTATAGTPGDTYTCLVTHLGTPTPAWGHTWGIGDTPGDTYTCLVTHLATDTPISVTVEVAGASGPSVEDVAGVALVAFVIGGLCRRLWPE